MPINPKMKEIIEKDANMSAEYKAKLIATFEDAPPDFQNGWMAQSDYTRSINEYKGKMQEFYDKSNTSITQWQSEVQKANEAVAQANARITELETAGGGSGIPKVPGQEDATMKEIAGLKTLISGLNEKLGTVVNKDQLREESQRALGYMGQQFLELNEISAQHQERFGKRFDKAAQAELITFANAKAAELNRPIGLEEAYNIKHGEELKKKEYEQWEREYEAKRKTIELVPGGGEGAAGGAPVERGPAQIRMEQEQNRRAGITDASKIGFDNWQQAAAAAANELVSEGKH